LLHFLINYKSKFAKTFNLTISNAIIATISIAFYKERKTLLLIDKNRHIFSSYARDFCANKLISFNYKFYEKQTIVKEINLYV